MSSKTHYKGLVEHYKGENILSYCGHYVKKKRLREFSEEVSCTFCNKKYLREYVYTKRVRDIRCGRGLTSEEMRNLIKND